jgi:hypothetical protein
MPYYGDPLVRYGSPWVFYDDPGLGHPPPPLKSNLLSLGTAMEYWEHTKARAQATLPVWQQYIPTFKVNGQTATNLDTMINQFEPKAQERTTAQDDMDAATRAARTSLLKMKILGSKVARSSTRSFPRTRR